MSDTTKLIIGIALAIVVVALIIWLFASARRREAEARRMEAEAMRAKLAERVPVVQEREDRASVTARIAQEARREAEAAAAEAARLEREAAEHRKTAEAARSEQDELARLADHVDPDVPTDREGFRVDDSGRRLGSSPVASALGMSALSQDDDEPDLADHENPFAAYAAEPAPTESTPTESTPTESTPTESSAHNPPSDSGAESEQSTDPESSAQFPPSGSGADPEHSTGVESSVQDVWSEGGEEGAAPAHSTTPESSAQDLPSGSAGDRAESGHSTGVGSTGRNVWSEVGQGAESGHSTTPDSSVDEGAPFDPVDEQPPAPARRRVSGLDEVADGGYGIGSAAPIEDGAQPLGHPIMGYHETRTFLGPEAPGYGDTEPDVWFYDEDAARRAGFHAAGEE